MEDSSAHVCFGCLLGELLFGFGCLAVGLHATAEPGDSLWQASQNLGRMLYEIMSGPDVTPCFQACFHLSGGQLSARACQPRANAMTQCISTRLSAKPEGGCYGLHAACWTIMEGTNTLTP
jgi:hypothetical protein